MTLVMQVFDAFMFFNELDLLELRLRELGEVVDHFVLIEANATHTLKPKPFVFEQNQVRLAPSPLHSRLELALQVMSAGWLLSRQARFERWLPQIIQLQVESDYLEQHRGASAWDTETLQRNALFHAVGAQLMLVDPLLVPPCCLPASPASLPSCCYYCCCLGWWW